MKYSTIATMAATVTSLFIFAPSQSAFAEDQDSALSMQDESVDQNYTNENVQMDEQSYEALDSQTVDDSTVLDHRDDRWGRDRHDGRWDRDRRDDRWGRDRDGRWDRDRGGRWYGGRHYHRNAPRYCYYWPYTRACRAYWR
jgi:hypothetical protein